MVLMRVDFPRPVCPRRKSEQLDMNQSTESRIYHIPTQITLNWNPRFKSLRSICVVILSKPTWLRGYTYCWGACRSMVAIAAVEYFVEIKYSAGRFK
jgi:hypothetical protein